MVSPKAKSKKTKSCNRGFTCGRSCISKAKTCRSNLGKDGKKIVETFAEFVKRIAAEEAEKQAQTPPAGGGGAPKDQLPSIPKSQMEKELEARETSGRKAEREQKLAEIYRENFEQIAGSDVNRDRWARSKSMADVNLSDYEARIASGAADRVATEQRQKFFRPVTQEVGNNYEVNYTITPFRWDTQDLFQELGAAGGNKMLPETEELVNRLANGVQMHISWGWTDFDEDREVARIAAGEELEGRDALRIALAARKMWKNEILPDLPPGTILSNSPIGGPNGVRASGYRRQGFGDSSLHNNHQYAIVNEQGKIIPLQVAFVDPDNPAGGIDNRGNLLGVENEDSFGIDPALFS